MFNLEIYLTCLFPPTRLFGFVTSIVVYTALSYIFPARSQQVTHTIYGIEDTEAYQEKYDEAVLRRDSMVGNPKGFSNINGLDSISSGLKLRESMDMTARKSIDIRRASRASQGGQSGPGEPGGVPEHLKGVDEKVLKERGIIV